MRFFIFDKYNTWYDWRLTLTGKNIPDPEPKTNYVELDGMHGTLDLSEALTGEVIYRDRTLTASFWTSEGTQQERLAVVKQVTAALHGRVVDIIEPDDPTHFFRGRVKVKSKSHDAVHAELTIEAVCEPWRYAVNETRRTVMVNGTTDVVIRNDGDKTLCPNIEVVGSVTITTDAGTVTLETGTYKVATLKLRQGVNIVNLSGSGTVTFTYREADL